MHLIKLANLTVGLPTTNRICELNTTQYSTLVKTD